MRDIGDAYVRSEFRLHKTAKPEQARQFFDGWQRYLDQLLMTARARESASVGSLDDKRSPGSRDGSMTPPVFHFGADLPQDVELSDEQRAQLEKLRSEAGKARRPPG